MYVSEKKIDELIMIANANERVLMEMSAKIARLAIQLNEVMNRARATDLRHWAAARATLGLSTPPWDEKFSRNFNFDEMYVQLDAEPVTPKPKPRPGMPTNEDVRAFVARQKHLTRPFSVSSGPGWARLIISSLEKIFKLARSAEMQIGIFQICERDGRLKIEIESAGLERPLARELERIADYSYAQSGLICEICGAEGTLRQIDGRQKTRCVGHAIHGDD